jgi:hypothetical protein
MRAGFPTGTHKCRSSEEAHSLLGRRECAYREDHSFRFKEHVLYCFSIIIKNNNFRFHANFF